MVIVLVAFLERLFSKTEIFIATIPTSLIKLLPELTSIRVCWNSHYMSLAGSNHKYNRMLRVALFH